MIKKINLTNTISINRKALYYKALYQEISKISSEYYKLTLNNMYKKYFEYKKLLEYTFVEKNMIYKCKNNNTNINELYKKEYIKYSRYA